MKIGLKKGVKEKKDVKEICNHLQNKHTFKLGIKLLCNYFNLEFTSEQDSGRIISFIITGFINADQYCNIRDYLQKFKNRNYNVLVSFMSKSYFQTDSFLIIQLFYRNST